jgi:hypothetical protein
VVRPIGVAVQVGLSGDPAEDQDGVDARLDAGDDVRIHPVADDDGLVAVALEQSLGVAHDERIGFADEIRLPSGGHLDRRDQGPARRSDPFFRRTCDVRIGPQQPGAAQDQLDGGLDLLVAVATRLAYHDIVRAVLIDRKPGLINAR